jgi:hypothetical protein
MSVSYRHEDMRREESRRSRQLQSMQMKRQNINYSSEAFGEFAILEDSN